jgi:hypothetical protein
MTAPTPTMTCETFSQRLGDFLEGDLDGAERAAQESHARSCRACGAMLADLRRVTAQAPVLPALRPSHDLWSGIAARIASPAIALHTRRPLWRSPAVFGAAVAATFALAAVLGYETTHRDVPAASTVPAVGSAQAQSPVTRPQRTAAARLAATTPAAVEATYDVEIGRLRAIIDARRPQLDQRTVGIIDKNLKVIDDAIAACKAALAADPASRFLIRSLDQSLDDKVEFLKTAALLPTRT